MFIFKGIRSSAFMYHVIAYVPYHGKYTPFCGSKLEFPEIGVYYLLNLGNVINKFIRQVFQYAFWILQNLNT